MRKALRDVFGFLRDYHEMATLILLQLLALGILLHLDNAGGNVALFCAFLLIVQLLALYLIYRIFKRAQRRVDEQINQAYLQKAAGVSGGHLLPAADGERFRMRSGASWSHSWMSWTTASPKTPIPS